MKILQLIQRPQLRGAEVFASQLSNHLISLGHEVKILALFPGKESLPFNGEVVTIDRPPALRSVDLQGWRKIADVIADFNPDIVQANAGDTLKYAVLSRLFFGWKSKIVFRNASTMSLYLKSAVVKRINSFLLKKVDLVISVSHESKRDILQLFPFLKDRTTVIPIGVEPDVLHPHEAEKEFTVIHIGGFTFEKNHEGVLRIMMPVLRRHQELRLLLVGDGPRRAEVEANAMKSPEGKRIEFLGFRRDALKMLSKAKLLILPSLVEGLPGVVLEAMALKIPVVAYNVGGVSEIVSNGATGYLVTKGDESGFIDSIEKILAGDVGELTEAAYSNVVNHYQNPVIASKFSAEYNRLIGN